MRGRLQTPWLRLPQKTSGLSGSLTGLQSGDSPWGAGWAELNVLSERPERATGRQSCRNAFQGCAQIHEATAPVP